MMRLACIALLAAAVVVAGCGSKKPKPTLAAADAQRLLTQLDQASSNFDKGACSGARFDVAQLQQKVAGLPSNVDPTLRTNLHTSLARLDQLIQQQCQRQQTTTTSSSSSTTSTTPSTTTTTSTTTTSSSSSISTTTTSQGGGVLPPTTTAPSGGATVP
ncbi:MAG: hypothetical protein ACXVRH_01295 [Thermoleophilaceae bacterium]